MIILIYVHFVRVYNEIDYAELRHGHTQKTFLQIHWMRADTKYIVTSSLFFIRTV